MVIKQSMKYYKLFGYRISDLPGCHYHSWCQFYVVLYVSMLLVSVLILTVVVQFLFHLFTCSKIWSVNVSESTPTAQQVGPDFIRLDSTLGVYSSQDYIYSKDHLTI